MEIQQRIDLPDWDRIKDDMNEKGYSCVSTVLAGTECDELVSQYGEEGLYRKTINMERYRFGFGEYKYYQYPLPGTHCQ
jgi:hypothetical protein